MIKCQRIISAQMKAKTIIYYKKFKGFPTNENFLLIEEELPSLENGEFLAEAEFLSVDPYMRTFSRDLGKTMMGEQVAKITASKNDSFPVGEYVVGEWGWRTHTVATDTPGNFLNQPPRILQGYEENKLPRSLALGVLGMPGNTAYFGLLQVCKPAAMETVVVSGAGGAVGIHVGQIAKNLHCEVIGITGSDEKGHRLVNEFHFDAYVNYKSPNFKNALIEATPHRIDCYFDNVGGEISSVVLNQMNKFGRVAICGSISTYNADTPSSSRRASEVQTPVKVNHLRMEGLSVTRWSNQWTKGIEQNFQWIKEGKLNYAETVTHGFENMPQAFIGLFKGENFGKAIVKV